MPPTRTRPAAAGIVVGLPASLFYVTTERRRHWRPVREERPLVNWKGEIDLRDDPSDERDGDAPLHD